MSAQVLNTFSKRFVYEKFDASNPEHVKAYVCLKKFGRQHPTIRFYIEDPFLTVPHLMESRVADQFLASVPGVVEAAEALLADAKGTLTTGKVGGGMTIEA